MKGFGDNHKSEKKKIKKSTFSTEEVINQVIQLHLKGNISEAEKYYKQLLIQGCNDHRIFSNYGVILQGQGKLQDAELLYRKAIELKPDFADAYSNLGTILKDLGKLEEAEISTRKVIEINPNFAAAHLNLGAILIDLGNLKGAEMSIRKAIEIDPKLAKAYYVLSTIYSSVSEKDWEHYLFTEDILKSQNEIDSIDIYFARAKILENKLKYKKSATMFKKANKLNREVYGSNYVEITNEITNYFKIWQVIKNKQNQEENPIIPIFIVGLPRSGKTITESILGYNKSLLRCGEDNALSIAIHKYLNKKETPENKNIYQLFIKNISKTISSESFISITRPGNYIYTGIIASHIRNSKVIYCYRNPLDNIKEIYCSNLANKFTFKTSIIESARVILSINDLMEEYKKIFNSKIYFLNYDHLVINKEKEIKSLINWLGWEYKQKYLNPSLEFSTTINLYNNDSGINTKHLNSWKNYQELLKPAIEIINSSKYQNLIS